jgi:hypothetical protein
MEFDKVWADVQSRGALITDFYDEDGVLRSTQEILTQIGQLTGNVDMNGLINQFTSTMTDLKNTAEVEVGTKLNTDALNA